MKWNEFTESAKDYPEKVVESIIEGFPKAAKNLAEIVIIPMDEVSLLSSFLENDFQFNVYLRSSYVPSYKLRVCSLGYNIELAPIYLALEESIFENVYQRKPRYKEKIILKDESELKLLLEHIFQSPRFIEIVAGVMKIASKNKELLSKY